MIPIIFARSKKSKSARSLSKTLKTKRVYTNDPFVPKQNHLIINLGESDSPFWSKPNTLWINRPNNIPNASNKHTTFKLLKGKVSIPLFSTDKQVALKWLKEGKKVVCRELLCACQGKGIVIANTPEELSPNTKLYVKYFPKKIEYRVHVAKVGNEFIAFDFVEKKKRKEIPNDEMNYEIRNHGQWVFTRQDVKLPDCVLKESIKVGPILGLELYSVDICYSQKNDNCVVLEANTCSGMEGTTIINYANIIKKMCEQFVAA